MKLLLLAFLFFSLPVNNAKPQFDPPIPITGSYINRFIQEDPTNHRIWSPKYNCQNFSRDVVNNAREYNIIGERVVIVWMNQQVSHMIVRFNTPEGWVYFEPQSDDFYYDLEVGKPFCAQRWCWGLGNIETFFVPPENEYR